MSKLEEMDIRRRPVALSCVALAIMSCQTTGIVYSDLGTSPLQVPTVVLHDVRCDNDYDDLHIVVTR